MSINHLSIEAWLRHTTCTTIVLRVGPTDTLAKMLRVDIHLAHNAATSVWSKMFHGTSWVGRVRLNRLTKVRMTVIVTEDFIIATLSIARVKSHHVL